MFAFLRIQPFAPAAASPRPCDRLLALPRLPSEAPVARVERTVSRHQFGRVSYEGVSWRAKCVQELSYLPGDRVKVLYRQDNALWVDTLLEQPLNLGSIQNASPHSQS